MSKRGRKSNEDFRAFKAKIAKKRMRKEEPMVGGSEMDYITVQRLSSKVEGRYQKYARIAGVLTMVPLDCESTSQISKTLHVRFIERSEESQTCEKVDIKESKSELITEKPARPMSSSIVTSVPLSAMLTVGKLMQPTVDIVSIQVEEFDLGGRSWRHPFEIRLQWNI